MYKPLALAAAIFLVPVGYGPAADPSWAHSGSLYVLTTPEGADLPAGAVVEDFPLLVRLHRDFFDFRQAKPDGADVRFTTAAGAPLAYQIEEWDAAAGHASVWVRVPRIVGNARQELRMLWGRADARSESDGRAVFNAGNGYLSVWHMAGAVRDEVGTLESKDTGTTPAAGVVGGARHFADRKGVFCGDEIAGYPAGAAAHTTEAWFRAERPNARVVAWGNEQAQGKVVMHYRSPPHVKMDCYFSGADVSCGSRLPPNEWVHVAHTYEKGDSKIYVNGRLDGRSKTASAPLALRTPVRLWIGGWYHNYDFTGDVDETRVSSVARSADWLRLQYENQKPLQTLVGPVVAPGGEFAVSASAVTVAEGGSVTLTARAGGAQKLYWTVTRGGREELAATDRLAFTFEPGRVVGDERATIRLKAVYPGGVKTRDVSVTVREAVPEPAFRLVAPATWDGRTPVEVVPVVANAAALAAAHADKLKFTWTVSGVAAIRDTRPDRLVLTRGQNSGRMIVTVAVDNGGRATTHSATIDVTEPKSDPWVARRPGADETPEEGQFYAREPGGEGTLHCTGTLPGPADAVFLRLFAGDTLLATQTQKPAGDNRYTLSAKLKAGLVKYRVEFGTTTAGREAVLHRAGDLVCGDAYLIQGQSNALATDTRETSPAVTNEWVRSYAGPSGRGDSTGWVRDRLGKSPRPNLWCKPVWKAGRGTGADQAELGYWGMELARRLVESRQVPVFVVNGAVGGSRIDEHQATPGNPRDLKTIYGRTLWRLEQAKLTHGVRAVIWHQGENDQGADGPTGGYGWETYQQYFVDLAAAWKTDLPNVQHYYVFQIFPNACAMGAGHGDRLREVQRRLPRLYSNLSILSTVGVRPPGGCHFPLAGWAEFARMLQPLVERDLGGPAAAAPLTPPDLKRAYYVGTARDTVALEFDQPVVWRDTLADQFSLDGVNDVVASGSASGNVVTLKLKAPSSAGTVAYLSEKNWSQEKLLLGRNGIAALTFCAVPVEPPATGK